MSALWPHQTRSLLATEDGWERGMRAQILRIPTGGGKTITAMEVIRRALAKRQRVMFLVHRDNLVRQAIRAAEGRGLACGVIKAGFPEDRSEPFQVASVQTLSRRDPWPCDLLIPDEAHRADFDDVVRQQRAAGGAILGLTATPERANGTPLGDLYERIIDGATYKELLDARVIVPFRAIIPDPVNMVGVRKTFGDYAPEALAARMSESKVIGNVADTWEMHSNGIPTLMFCVNLAHAGIVRAELQRRGVACVIVDGKTEPEDRDAIQARLTQGNLQVIINVGVYTEGLDIPSLGCVTILRPTLSRALWMQMCNRGCRSFPGKSSFKLVMHVDSIWHHGSPQADHPWDLKTSSEKKRSGISGAPIATCPKCHFVRLASEGACPECGASKPPVFRQFSKAGALVEVDPSVFADIKPVKVDSPEHKHRKALYVLAKVKRVPDAKSFVNAGMETWRKSQGLTTVWVNGKPVTVPVNPQDLF